ncbi:serine/threonine-protein phosphatase 2A regulatory subunit B' [Schistosoma bovis]|uniref:Serine/threonine-protein phosphatase 2A regulatory subunit B n=1 Tax=Schistosoma bovis TaxID=6184 RepID=A0A430QI02_SCHBO|nr:serine/threonine-protein phosphatase 2A regulatory subunit B' [Schistosoma bovis]
MGENYRDDSITGFPHAPSPVPEFSRAASSLSPVSLGRKFRQNDVKRQDIDRIATAPQPPRQLSSRFVNVSHDELKALPLLVETPSGERETLLLSKLRMCSTLFDFTDNTAQLKSKEIKRLTLLELAEFISINSSSLTEPVYVGIINLVKLNAFRTIATIYTNTEMSDYADNDDEQISNLEPSWPHLQLVYDLFLRFISSPDFQASIGKKYLDQQFFKNLLELFKSEDPRERELVKMILHRAYGKLVTLRPFIRRLMNNIFLRIINGFQTPLKEEHKQFLRRVLLPLHKSPTMSHFHAQLTYCTTEFIKKDSSLFTMIVHDGLLRFWPRTNSIKEMLFLNELEACLECTGPIEFQAIIPEIFPRLAKCIESLHFQVSERVLMFWNNEYLLSLMSENIDKVLPIIFNSLAQSRNHWNKTVHGLICNVLNWAIETDQKLVEQCSSKLIEEQKKNTERLQKHQAYWNRVELAAQKAKQPSVNFPVSVRTPSISISLTGIRNKYPISNVANNRNLSTLNEFPAKLFTSSTDPSSNIVDTTGSSTSGSSISSNNLVNNIKYCSMSNQPSEFASVTHSSSFTTDYASLPGTSNTLGSSSVVTSLSNIPPESSTAIITSVSSVLLTSNKSNSQVIQRQQQSSQMLNLTDNNTRSNTTVNSSTSVSNLNKKLSSPKASTSITYTARKPMSSLQKQPLRSNTSLTANKDTLSSSAVSSGQITSGTNSSTIKTERSTNLRRTTTLRSLNT